MINTKESLTQIDIQDTEPKPSLIGILILFLTTIFLYSFGIHQLSNTVTNLVEAVVEEVARDFNL